MKDIQGSGAQLGRVFNAEVGGQVQSSAPQDVKQREPAGMNVIGEVARRAPCLAYGEQSAMLSQRDGVEQLGSAKSGERESASRTLPPRAEAA